jgi:hypothetical protein
VASGRHRALSTPDGARLRPWGCFGLPPGASRSSPTSTDVGPAPRHSGRTAGTLPWPELALRSPTTARGRSRTIGNAQEHGSAVQHDRGRGRPTPPQSVKIANYTSSSAPGTCGPRAADDHKVNPQILPYPYRDGGAINSGLLPQPPTLLVCNNCPDCRHVG